MKNAMRLTPNQLAFLLLGIIVITSSLGSAYPALPHGHMQKRQSYARSNQLPPPGQDQYYGQASYKNYNYNSYEQPRAHYNNNNNNNNGFYQPASSNYYYDYPPSQYHYGGRDALQGAYASVNPIQREITVRNGQLRQKEYQQRTGHNGGDTYDPFYFYVNPVAAANAAGLPPPPGNPLASPSPSIQASSIQSSPDPSHPSPTKVSASLTASVTSRDHAVGGPPRNRRNSLTAPPPRESYFDNEISGDKYEILTSKPTYPRHQNSYPPSPSYPSSRYSSTAPHHHHHPSGNPNQFLNYEQIVGAQPPRYANGSPPNRGQPWSIQIGTQLKVNDDAKGPSSGNRFYVRDERNTRSRQPQYRK